MRAFDEIRKRAEDRKGGAAALAELSSGADRSPDEIAALGDAHILGEMTRRVFQAGFNWKVIESKWPGFEAAFDGFDPNRCAMMSDEDLDRHLGDTRIVRHGPKILSVRDNAIFLKAFGAEAGSAARAIGDWPVSDQIGLLDVLKRRASRLGGTSGQYFLRGIGKESFVLSRDVVAALIDAGVVDKAPGSKTSMAAVQAAFNGWKTETGLSLTNLSRILAMSIDG